MDPVGKEIDGIIHWIPQKRKRFCLKEQNTINHWMVHAKKREQNGIVYEALKTRKKLLSDRAEWYNSLNPEGKENQSSDGAEWSSSLNPEDKENSKMTMC